MSENCAECGHSRATHEVHGGYKPYGWCNYQHDLCGCREFKTKKKLEELAGTDNLLELLDRADGALAMARLQLISNPESSREICKGRIDLVMDEIAKVLRIRQFTPKDERT